MKIIKQPDISNWTYTFKCRKCEAELEANASDVKYYSWAGDGRDVGGHSFIAICVLCSHQHDVPEASIPKLLQIKIQEKSEKSSTNYMDR